MTKRVKISVLALAFIAVFVLTTAVFSMAGKGKTKAEGATEVEFPTFGEVVYEAGRSLKDLDPEGSNYQKITDEYGVKYVTSDGYFVWNYCDEVPSVGNNGYYMFFYPTNGADYSGEEGYSVNDGIASVKRAVKVSVKKATPTPCALYAQGKDYAEYPVGMKLSKLVLPGDWRVKSEFADSVYLGAVEDTKTISACVEYAPKGDTSNYEAITSDLKIKFVATKVGYYATESDGIPHTYSRLNVYTDELGTTVESVYIEQLLPIPKEGYRQVGWRLNDGTIIDCGDKDGAYSAGESYRLSNLDLIDVELRITAIWEPKEDTPITVFVYNEKIEGGYDNIPSVTIIDKCGVSDSVISYEMLGVKIPTGYELDKTESTEKTEGGYLIKADGRTEIKVYLKRKTREVKFLAGEYSGAEPGGLLPNSTFAKHGISIDLPTETDFKKYGYALKGWTDGSTEKDGTLKVYRKTYVVKADIEGALELSIVLEPYGNTEYLITEYLDGVPHERTAYGRTDTTVDISKNGIRGYEREERAEEVLSGVITGFEKGEDGAVTGGARLELKIYYKSIDYRVKIDAEGVEDITAKCNEKVVLPPPLERENYEFVAYLINGVMYAPGSEIVMPANDVNVRVVWQKKEEEERFTEQVNYVIPTEEERLPAGAIVGIVLGAIGGTALITVGVLFLVKYLKSKKKNQ